MLTNIVDRPFCQAPFHASLIDEKTRTAPSTQCPHRCGHDGVGVVRGQSSVPGRHPVHRRPEDEIQRHLGVDVGIQLTAGDILGDVRAAFCFASSHE
jgi:hypothetical protein